MIVLRSAASVGVSISTDFDSAVSHSPCERKTRRFGLHETEGSRPHITWHGRHLHRPNESGKSANQLWRGTCIWLSRFRSVGPKVACKISGGSARRSPVSI